ncbi:DUF6885 family protein [Prauserella endophytica]|uniref:Uncharacterized protein n=1 Tax=Prauserella endophytica TaxID=1592324 RepID=A0ABY2S478_9PSEU|nr:hypothetical protein [Prauserella endophytica]TKG69608.1 hypothetical protein FCN18_19105 [Prauserella endophytica]
MRLSDEVRSLPGGGRVVTLAAGERPQKDELCGAFAGLVALRAGGAEVTDQDEVALAAGTVLTEGAPSGSLPPGEKGRADFRLALPRTADPARAGTSAIGVVRAIETLSEGALAVVPASGEWSASVVARLLDGVRGLALVAVIANVDTGAFAAPDTPPRALRDYLDTGLVPLWTSRWRVGHFVLVAGVLSGEEGILVSIVDTYESLGDNGVHLQPIGHVAAALRREGGAPGGVLLVVPAAEADAARAVVTGSGLRAELWDNGSPAPLT